MFRSFTRVPGSRAAICRMVPVVGAESTSYQFCRVVGIEPGQRRLNNIQTTGRQYRNVTEPSFEIDRTKWRGFTHTPIAQPSLNTVFSSSRLLLPLLGANRV